MLTKEPSLADAKIAEEKFDWGAAAELYQGILDIRFQRASQDSSGLQFSESVKVVDCLVNFALQSDNLQQFDDRIESAIKASTTYFENSVSTIVDSYFRARVLLLRSWITDNPDTRKDRLNECTQVVEEAIAANHLFENPDEGLLTCVILLLRCFEDLWVIETKAENLDEIITKGRSFGHRAIEAMQDLHGDKDKLGLHAQIYCMTAWFCSLGVLFYESEEKRIELLREKEECWAKFDSISLELEDPNLTAASLVYRQESLDPRIVVERARAILPKILPSGNNLLIGALFSQIPVTLNFDSMYWDYPEKVFEAKTQLEHFYKESLLYYSRVRAMGLHRECLSHTYEMPAWWYLNYSYNTWRIDPNDRRLEFVNLGLDIAKAGYERLSKFSHRAIVHLGSAICALLTLKARLETDLQNNRKILDEASHFSKVSVDLEALVEPHRDWDYGNMLLVHSDAQFLRGLLESNHETRIGLVKNAIETCTKSMDHFELAYGKFRDPITDLDDLSTTYHEPLQKMLRELYELAQDRDTLLKRLDILHRGKAIYEQIGNLPSLAIAEGRIAMTYSLLGDHSLASKSYGSSTELFAQASKKILHLSGFYLDYCRYMNAWEEVEKARLSHYREDYEAAGLSYEKSKKLVENSEMFAYFASHYEAYSKLERAENLSRSDSLPDIEGSVKEFENAADLFSKSYDQIHSRLPVSCVKYGCDIPQELTESNGFHQDYCKARAQVEEARLLFRRGEKFQSMEKYKYAAQLFEQLADRQRFFPESQQIRAIMFSCQAWSKMEEAETFTSSELYDEAAELFLRARNLLTRRKTSLVSQGNSKYCTALHWILEFKRGSRIDDYMSAKSNLEEASVSFANAGFERSVGWIAATEKMLDAVVYVKSALRESTPEAKAKNFAAAEKLLESAGRIFDREGYSSKKAEISTLLNKIGEEREFAVSLSEMFTAPAFLSSTRSFNVPGSPRGEQPIGDHWIFHSNVQIVVNVPKYFILGKSVECAIDLINTGQEPVFLIRLEDFIPEDFQLDKFEGSSDDFEIDKNTIHGRLIFGGMKVPPFGVKSIIFRIRSEQINASEVTLQPKIIYSNEDGQLFEKSIPVGAVLSINPAIEFRFDEQESKMLFDYLVKEFVRDHMSARLEPSLSGWRTLGQITREGKLPYFSIYNRKGGVSPPVGELIRRGLVEKRVSTGKRGRGGEVTQIRIAYERDAIRSYVNEQIRNRFARKHID